MYLATLMLLGSGELGREFAIAAKRLGFNAVKTPLRTDLFLAAEKKNEQLVLL